MLELFHRWLTLLGISLLLFEDCQSLFLRHSETGKCITVSEELVYRNPDHAFPYFVVMTDNCLDDKAQFRYLDTELLHNIEKEGTLVSSSNKNYKSRWSVYKGVSTNGILYQDDATHSLKQTAAGSLFFYKRDDPVCAESKLSSKYLLRKTYCSRTQQEFTFGSVTAFNGKMENVSCSPIQHMVVKSADYGYFDNSGTFNPNANIDTRCSQLTNCQVKSGCDGKTSCKLTLNNNLLPSKYCSNTSKQIYTKYTCVDTYTSAITAAGNIRLTNQNEGYIEIKDGSIWRKVVEENWNKKRQKWLCQHLGFEEIDSNVIYTGKLGSGHQIATGDLICYDTQSSGTSCCVHLTPSISTSSTKIPYVRCKICDNPLLQNESTFPDSVFSGSGDSSNTYKDARITKGGWCPSDSGTAYLTLDLQKEYHITQVVVMADKEQTKLSGGYSMEFSHNTSYENSVQISGNQNGYHEASKTDLSIYNVRHVKIQSTNVANFCLRIELCGEVQTPAAVSNVNVSPSPYSARVTWKLPTRQDSSYITQIIVYLNGYKRQIIPRGTQVTIDNLTPDTKYIVGIETKDSSSQRRKTVYSPFRTDEAAPSGPPTNVVFKSREKNSLEVSWEAPQIWNGIPRGYQVCYSFEENSSNPSCSGQNTSLSYTISQLLPSTKYFVTISAATNAGSGPKSSEISKITNGESVDPVVRSSSSLEVSIANPGMYVKEVLVIVQSAPETPTPVEDIQTNDLKPYQTDTDTEDPYITAYLKADILPLTFIIGDGKEYNSPDEKYPNQRLEQKSSYIVFLRFFETKESFFSTEWSRSVRVPPVLPVVISNIQSTALKKYTVSWEKPSLPILKYAINYGVFNEPKNSRNISKDTTSFIVNVDYEKRYIFYIQVVAQAGISDVTSETWFSRSAPLEMPTETNDGYTVKLRKPREDQKIKNVTLVLLKSKKSENLPAPEDIKVQKSPPSEEEDDIAFVAKVFDITEFQEDTIEISLQQSKDKRRKKRNAVVVPALAPKSTYRTAQLNTDGSGNKRWSYWSESFTFTGAINRDKRNEDGGGGGGDTGVAIAASVAAVVIVVAVVLAVIYFRRRKRNKQHKEKQTSSGGKKRKKSNDEEMNVLENRDDDEVFINADDTVANRKNEDIYSNERDDVEEKAHSPVPLAEFSHYVKELKANDNHEFQKQYDDLPKDMKTSWEVSKKPFNKKKNRYGNIVTYDYSRVVLSGDETEDYINASFVDGMKENSYIASQGPNKLTVDDMWRMVWEQRSYSIVMVTSLIELGKPKCEKYWPNKGTEKYGDIEVTLLKIEEYAYYFTHTLQLKKDGEEREVKHYYFQSWPDHGVPKYPTSLLAFRRHFRAHHLEQSGPIVVHCSAGVGRTGVFLAIDTILDKLEKGVIDSIDVFGEVHAMRERRMNMVQTLEQYIFIHEAILETILCGMNEVDSSKIQEEIKQLAEMKASGMTGFQEKFKRLGEVSPKCAPDCECAAALIEGNDCKNRNKSVYPAESNRVPLQYISGVENSDYINAVFVHGFLGRNYFIATQSPLPNTINDFWRLVHSQKTSTIVLLNNVKDGTSFPRFWPTKRGQPTQYDSLTLQLESEKESDGISTRKFILSPYPDLSDGQVVNIFHYTKWSDHRVPSDASGVIKLTSLVENSRKSYGHGPIIVACSDGAGRTGTYIAISNLLERMKIEQAMDVFQSIKIIRGARPQFVENAEQYQFCYTAVMAYLDAFSEYANFD